ncbi:acyltransferase family protein [Parvularcula marina]|uniref:acyltransferase family protein n=1 Tax=Parvularcula marina TaxID=2292771 RepID=UPI00351171C8
MGHPKSKRLDIQGLRAIAVLAVVLFHGLGSALPGGFAGVDVFFVVSGYLITGILLRPMEEGRFSILDFYRRRVRRLFPALYTVMAFTLLGGLILFPPTLLIELVESQFFTTLFVSNFYFLDQTDYFDLQAELMPLLHTWSLGVEEQFYLLFPPLLWALHRFAKPVMWHVLVGLAVLSLVASQRWVMTDGDVAFYHPASRAFELLIGSLCVLIDRKGWVSGLSQRILGAVALPGMAVSFIFISAGSPFPGLLALLPCLSTAALLVSKDAFANRLISNGPMVWIGDISYSLYLWHWPLLVFAKFMFPGSTLAILIAIILAFGAAGASYRFIEQPFLRSKQRFILPKGLIAMAGSVAIALPIYLNDGVPGRFSSQLQAYLSASQDYNPDRPRCHMRSDRPIPYEDTCVYGAEDTPASVAVWGDSHGTELAMMLGEELADNGRAVRSITMSGCPASMSRYELCNAQIASTLVAMKADPAMKTILLVSNLHGSDDFAMDTIAGLKRTALDLKSAGKQVVFVYPIPTMDFDPPSKLALDVRAGGSPENSGISRQRYEQKSGHLARDLAQFVAENDLIGVSPADLFCDEEKCRVYRDGVGVLYYNQGHLSLNGARLLAAEVERALEDASRGATSPASAATR